MSRYANVEKMPSGPNWDALNDKEKATVLSFLIKLPTVDVEEVKHGKWVKRDGMFYCSECNFIKPYDLYDTPDNVLYWECNYCRICGAKMDKEKEE